MDSKKNEYIKFKKLLEYFVAHLEWVDSRNIHNRGYIDYIKPIIDSNTFKNSGQGYSGGNIQNQIEDWEQYPNGKICINIQSNFGNYRSVKSYLNWEGTGINVIAKWGNENIVNLSLEHYLFWLKTPRRQNLNVDKKIESLGLFDNKEDVTEDFKVFFDSFNKEIIDYNLQQEKNKRMQKIQPYINLLKNNHNLILTGAPGTGKTYLAKEIANAINAKTEFVQFHPSYDYTDFVEGLRPIKKDSQEIGFELKNGAFKTICEVALKNLLDSKKTLEELAIEDIASNNIVEFLDSSIESSKKFHLKNNNEFEITEYNDNFIEVYVPDNQITSKLKLPVSEVKQLLLNSHELKNVKDVREFFGRSHNRQSDSYIYTLYNDEELSGDLDGENKIEKIERKNFVIIIDEINRAEISKVFGELFFSIDPDYRGERGKVKTQYSNLQDEDDVFSNGFYIPENVYIIGTMNDIDRSVESMDFAMRRRFAWKEIKAPSSKNGDDIPMWDVEIDNWKMSDEAKREATRRIIALNDKIESIQGLGSAFHVGPAYFLKLKNYNEDFNQLWDNHLEGLLFEYLRGFPESDKQLNELKTAFNTTVESQENVESN